MSTPQPLSVVLSARQDATPYLPFTVTYEGELYRVLKLHDVTADLQAKRDDYNPPRRTSCLKVDPDVIQWAPREGAPQPARQPLPELRVVEPQGIEEKEEMAETARLSKEESQELSAKGLKRCFKCHRDMPIAELNSGGFCRDGKACRAVKTAEWVAAGTATNPTALPSTASAPKRHYKKRKKGAIPIKRSLL